MQAPILEPNCIEDGSGAACGVDGSPPGQVFVRDASVPEGAACDHARVDEKPQRRANPRTWAGAPRLWERSCCRSIDSMVTHNVRLAKKRKRATAGFDAGDSCSTFTLANTLTTAQNAYEAKQVVKDVFRSCPQTIFPKAVTTMFKTNKGRQRYDRHNERVRKWLRRQGVNFLSNCYGDNELLSEEGLRRQLDNGEYGSQMSSLTDFNVINPTPTTSAAINGSKWSVSPSQLGFSFVNQLKAMALRLPWLLQRVGIYDNQTTCIAESWRLVRFLGGMWTERTTERFLTERGAAHTQVAANNTKVRGGIIEAEFNIPDDVAGGKLARVVEYESPDRHDGAHANLARAGAAACNAARSLTKEAIVFARSKADPQWSGNH